MGFEYNQTKPKITSKHLISSKDGMNLYQLIMEVPSSNGWKISKSGFAYLNEKGKLAIKGIFDSASPFSNGLAVVNRHGKMGVINKTGKIILPISYEAITSLPVEEYEKNYKEKFKYFPKTNFQKSVFETLKMQLPSNGKLNVKIDNEWKEVSVAHAMDFSSDRQA